jgi:hypothetical protein
MRVVVTLVVVVSLTAALAGATDANQVRVTKIKNVVKDCKYLGEVKGKTGWGRAGMGRALQALKKNTAKKKGNTVLLVEANANAFIPTYRGKAYYCEEWGIESCAISSGKAQEETESLVLAAEMTPDGRMIAVSVTNTSERPIQLILQEWSATAGTNTSSLVPADTPNGQVAGIVVSPVTIPSGVTYSKNLFMRSNHSFEEGEFDLRPMFGYLGPPCPPNTELLLTYVVQTQDAKVMETAHIPIKWKGE